jgi:hypothetical protein
LEAHHCGGCQIIVCKYDDYYYPNYS